MLAGPKPPPKPLSIIALMRAMQDNTIATIPAVAYEQPVWEVNGLLGHQMFVSDPADVKRGACICNVRPCGHATESKRFSSAASR